KRLIEAARSASLSSSGGLSVMSELPLARLNPPSEYARCFQLVGEFMWRWGTLEAVINRGVQQLLGLTPLWGSVATANMQLRGKQHVVATLVRFYSGSGPSWIKGAIKTLRQFGEAAKDRNFVAHTPFGPDESGGVKFFAIKAKGKLDIPDIV